MGKNDLTKKKHLTLAIRYLTYALNNLEDAENMKPHLWVVSKHLKQVRKMLVIDGERAQWTYKDYQTTSTNDYLVYIIGAVNECIKDASTDNYIDIQLAMSQGLIKVVEGRYPDKVKKSSIGHEK